MPTTPGTLPPPLPIDPDSMLTLGTVAAELSFIAKYVSDYDGVSNPPQSEKDRIKLALSQAQADLAFVIAKILKSNLGQDFPIGPQDS